VSPDQHRPATGDHGRASQEVTALAPGRRALVAFGRFWWDFLVGDTPELLIGSLAALGAAALLAHGVGVRSVVVGSLPAFVVLVLVLSSLRARARIRAARRTELER